MRKSKKQETKKEKNQLINAEATINKIKALMVDPNTMNWVARGGARAVRERLLKINFDVIRNVVDRIPLINAIINTRIDQVIPFCKFVTDQQAREGEKGFSIVPINPDAKLDKGKVRQLGEFFEQTGFKYDAKREDDFFDYIQMLNRDLLTIDQIATEVQFNRLGEAVAFWVMDAATIKRTTEDYPKKNVSFVQEVDGKIKAEFNNNNLLFDYKNKRVDIRFRGYGYSHVEQCIDIITTLLFGYNHLRDQFIKDKIPKGFISVVGDIDQEGIETIQNYWYSAMSGAGGQWAIPILPTGKNGLGMDFKNIGQTNKDMEYHKLMGFVSSIIAAVFSFDIAELGLKYDDANQLIGESQAPRIESSKDRGLRSLLMFDQQHCNKILRKVTTDYKLIFVGFEIEDEKRKVEIREGLLRSTKSIDELRKADGEIPYNEDWSKIPLNPYVVQMVQADKQKEQGGGQDQGEGGFGEGEPEGKVEENQGDDYNKDEGEDEQGDIKKKDVKEPSEKSWKDLFKSMTMEKEVEDHEDIEI